MTECGRPANDIKGNIIDVNEVKRRINKWGKQRAAFTVCMTCVDRVRWSPDSWERSPGAVLFRELERCGGKSMRWSDTNDRPEAVRMNAELHAIAELIKAHPDEFEGYLSGLSETVSLDEMRRKRRSRRSS
jgi:hypothetical protein